MVGFLQCKFSQALLKINKKVTFFWVLDSEPGKIRKWAVLDAPWSKLRNSTTVLHHFSSRIDLDRSQELKYRWKTRFFDKKIDPGSLSSAQTCSTHKPSKVENWGRFEGLQTWARRSRSGRHLSTCIILRAWMGSKSCTLYGGVSFDCWPDF